MNNERKANAVKITLSKGGTAERTLELSAISIPDLWKIAHAPGLLPGLKDCTLGDKSAQELIVECWHIAHDLKRTLGELSQTLEQAEGLLRELAGRDPGGCLTAGSPEADAVELADQIRNSFNEA